VRKPPDKLRELMASVPLPVETVAPDMRAISNTNRLILLWQLGGGHNLVSELAQVTEIRQPTLSQQLGVLRQAGLVTAKRRQARLLWALGPRRKSTESGAGSY
jgi:ArsR family transcriptional regulator